MKKKILIICIVAAAVGCALGGWYFFKKRSISGADKNLSEVYVTTVSSLMGIDSGSQGVSARYSGVVESQKTEKVQLDSSRTVAEIFVKEDDEVKKGDPLVRYDSESLEMQLEQQNLEAERINNSITTQNQQIAELQKQAQNATGDTLLEYTTQIQEAQVNEKQSEYELKQKQAEIEKTTKSIDQSVVVSPIDGVVRSVTQASDASNGEAGSITIMENGDFRVRGTINEQNVASLSPGIPVTVYSRVDDTASWQGTVAEIDTSSPQTENSDNIYGVSTDTMTTTSKYSFYVTLDNYDGLMIGQHVVIEVGSGASEGLHTDGVWLYEGYFFDLDSSAGTAKVYVNDGGRIAVRDVKLGQYDEENMEYEVTEGLTQEDEIAWPDETVTENAPAVSMTSVTEE